MQATEPRISEWGITMPAGRRLTPEDEAELRRQCELVHARNDIFMWRNIAIIGWVPLLIWGGQILARKLFSL